MDRTIYYLARAKEAVMDFLSGMTNDIWHWFTQLNREEWVVLLAVVAGTGFLCMRGFGSRNEY